MISYLKSNSSSLNQGLNATSISSVDSFHSNNDYSVNLKSHSSYNTAIANQKENAEEQLFDNNGYNFTSGYGLIDAAAAVGKAAGEETFTDVPDVGDNNWGADLVKAPEVWAKGYTGQDVVVAVVDTGVDFNHEDLNDNIWTNSKEIADNGVDDDGDGYIDDVYGWNFADNNNNVLDKNGHGTHVSGTIAGEKNDIGVTGIAYDAKIMPVKVLNDQGAGSYASIANGIYYAVDHGANVINLSLNGDSSNSTVEKALEYASNKGVIVVMAAGNDGGFQSGYPARYADKWGIAVGAVDENSNTAGFSNKAGMSSLTYVTAPGVDVYSTVPGNKYTSYSGTSMAAPHVAGVVALMLSANGNLTDAQVRQIVSETAVQDTQVPSFGMNDSITNSGTTSSYFNVTNYQGNSDGSSLESLWSSKVSSSQDQLDNLKSVESSSFSVNSTLESQFSSYQTVLDNNVSHSIGDYYSTSYSEDILKKHEEMLEYEEW
ncbi:S8 family serine peptidase [Brasilonema sp. UFV-L1]|uniref:S8 family serine peptidase n=1 Tax=Brasilonema sp. UFV-L1 TaxID=2234130 RepID=UPI00145DE7D8|nr:S8 family serine peptidase [Brasilonema sp. UFV-L1]NMG10936.1 peptidase S8 [Brasilonema sp. UFV-L1]